MTLPNFIVIGAPKSGTTGLYSYIGQHPDIYCCSIKEPNYFALTGEKLNYVEPNGDSAAVNRSRITDLASYESLFDGVSGERAIGEASVTYLQMPEVPTRIKAQIPHAKLIAILRNPVDLAFSNYLMTLGHGVEPCATFEAAIRDQPRREQARCFAGLYVQSGLHFRNIQRFLEHFPREQIRIYLYDDFCADPVAVVQDIFRYLEVDDTFVPDTSFRINPSGIPKSMFVHRLLTPRTSRLASILYRRLPYKVIRVLAEVRSRNLRRPELPYETRQAVTDIFRDDIRNLQSLLDRDLSSWMDVDGGEARPEVGSTKRAAPSGKRRSAGNDRGTACGA